MLTRLVLVMVAFALFGCAGPREVYRARSVAFSRPEIGAETVRHVGDVLLEQGMQSEYAAIESPAPVIVGSGVDAFVLPAGRYLKTSEGSNVEVFAWDDASNKTQGGVVSGGETLKEIVIGKSESTSLLFVRTVSGKIRYTTVHPFQRIRTTVRDGDSFQQTLTYGGRVGNKIKISYQESAGGMADGAPTNTAEYDPSESNIVGYQGAQIEVIDATNQFIRYRVLSNFTKAKQ